METKRIEQFKIIVETGNLRKAAELLHISHSGLSKSMKALEAELGFALFTPSGRGIVVSDEGRKLYERTKRFLEEYEHFIGHNLNETKKVLRIGSFETFTSFFIGPLLQNYLPPMEVEIHELVPGRLEEALYYNKVDIGITYEPLPRQGVEFLKATTVPMSVFVLKNKFRQTPWNEIPFIVPVIPLEGAPSGVKGLDAWPEDKAFRKIQFRVDLLSTGLELTRQGLGAIFIPRFVAQLHNQQASVSHQLEALPLPKSISSIKRDVYIVKRDSSIEDDNIKGVARALRMICHDSKN